MGLDTSPGGGRREEGGGGRGRRLIETERADVLMYLRCLGLLKEPGLWGGAEFYPKTEAANPIKTLCV